MALAVQLSFAQEKTVKGIVSDASGPLPGVTVLVKGTSKGTQTDFDGNYTLKVKKGNILHFTYIGMADVFKKVGSSNVINVVMKEDAQALGEVVVTALGIKKKKDEDLSSATTVEAKSLQRSGESGIIQGLAGKTSGLKITKNNGDPGAGAYIQIRGQNTITGSASPLIIVDGVPISNTSVGNGVDGVAQQSRLNDISSDDIESVTVLKGASAAAVWGTGAANGVIVITTKSAKLGSGKLSVNVKSSVGVDKINVEFEKQNTFGQGMPNFWFGGDDYSYKAASFAPNTSLSWGDVIADRKGGKDDVTVGNKRFVSGTTGKVYYPIVNKNSRKTYNKSNRNLVFGDGMTLDNTISISYANNSSSTYLSYSNWDQQGIMKGKSSYNRQNIRLNQITKLLDNLTLRFNTSYAKIKSDRIQQGSNLSGLYLGYLRNSPDFDMTDYVGTYYDDNGVPTENVQRSFRKYLGSSAPAYNNPLWTINKQDNPNKVERFMIAPQLNWDIKDNLKLVARYGLDFYTDHRETFFPVHSSGGNANGYYSQTDIKEKVQNLNVFLQSDFDINENFDLGVILGGSLDQKQYESIFGSSQNFTNPNMGDLRVFSNSVAEDKDVSNYKEETRKAGVYSTISANFYKQLFIELTGRYERPSTLEKNIFYPSASLGWVFSKVLPDNDILTFGKIRASYGEIGIEPSAYSKSTLYEAGGISSSWEDELSSSAYGNPFTRSATLGNPDLKEERVKEFEVGADFRMFKNKVNLGVTYYDKKTEDAILNVDVPGSIGFSGKLANVAEITNKGLEVDLGIKLFSRGNFRWDINASYSHNKNLVKSLSGVKSVFLAGFTGTSSRAIEGHAMGTLWGGKFDRDDNGNYVLDDNGFPKISAEEGILGDPNPDWIGGIGTILRYKGLSLSAQFETSQGNDHWFGTEGVLKFFGIHPETANITTASKDLKTYDGRTIKSGTTFRGNVGNFGGEDVALTEEWYLSNGGGFGNQSESFVGDASWTRLREVTLGYALPAKYTEPIGLSNIEFSLSGRNLFLWTKVKGFDPDMNLTGASKGRGLDYFTNPATKSYIFTVKLGF